MNFIDRIHAGATDTSDVGLFSAIVIVCSLLGFVAGYAMGTY